MSHHDLSRPEDGSTRRATTIYEVHGDPQEVAKDDHDNTFQSQYESRYLSDSAVDPEPLLTVDQVARWLGKPKATLYAWRSRGLGPPGIRVGNALRYRRIDVERWLNEHTDQPPNRS